MKEIEEEIAKNTAEFDKKTVSKNDKKEEKEDDKDSKKDDKIILKKKVLLKPTLKPANITKFVRVLVVIAMATFTGKIFIIASL